MNDFDKVFASDIVDNMEFDTIIGSVEDGELIDSVGQNSLFTESGEDVTDVEDDDDEDEDEKNEVEESVEDIANLNVFDEAAKFSFLPRFKQVPELKKYEKTIAEAEDLLNSQGEPTKETSLKMCKLAIRVLDIWENVSDVLKVPMLVFIITIPAYLICRAFEYFCKLGQYQLAEQHGEKVIAKLHKCEKEAKDPKVKAKCKEQIEKVSKQMKKIKSDDYEESFSFEDEENYGVLAEDFDSVVGSDMVEDCECSEDHDDDFEDNDFDDSDFEDDDFEDNEDYGSNVGLQAFNEKPYCTNCESEIDSPEETDDIDQAMTDDEEGTVQDIRDIEDEPQPYAEDSDFFGEGVEDFENDENMTNDEDLSPDSEGALDDGDDIDSLEEMVNLMM